MSNYNGPHYPGKVRLLNDWREVPAGTECDATFYPELKKMNVYVELPNGRGGFVDRSWGLISITAEIKPKGAAHDNH